METMVEMTLAGFLIVTVLVSACCVDNGSTDRLNGSYPSSEEHRVEVIHFHGNHQCYNCKTVGAYAEETIKTYFPDEVEAGKLVFMHVNFEFPENRELVDVYRVTGSSLWIGTYNGEGFHAEQDVNVWYKIDDKEGYMNYLRGVIEDKLSEADV